MQNNIIQFQEIDKYQNVLGNKTHSLKKCVDFGFNVPKFIALPSSISKNMLANDVTREKIAGEIVKILPCKKYAVRSSALIEDKKDESFAGQFLTKTNVDGKDLNENIYDVLKQAGIYLNGELEKFSIIVQEYISPDIAGVTFTRNPNGNREMIIEYGFCEGEKIVSGEIKPQKISLYWHNLLPKKLPQAFFKNQIVEKFKDLEDKNIFPQDIEWCIQNNKFYILQTRPITTISDKQYKEIIFLEKFLSEKENYFFEKTEISEITPRPVTITFDILQCLYEKNGPIDKVYKKYGVDDEYTNFLKIIGNELYVDKEKEIKGLLPAYSYYNKTFSPRFSRLSKISRTIKNFVFLNKIKTSKYEKLFSELKTKIEEKQNKTDLESAIGKFLKDYELIFEINLLSGLSIKKINLILKNESINFSEIIDGQSLFVDLNKYSVERLSGLLGNSLDISDESVFNTGQTNSSKESETLKSWWQKNSELKRKMFQGKITEAIIYNRLRELGRWLTVKNINVIRKLLLELAEESRFNNNKNIYYDNFENILNNKISESNCIKNKIDYESYNYYNFTSSIVSSVLDKKCETLGVSSGLAEGILKTQEMIQNWSVGDKKAVLYTETLSPDLTIYFDRIFGIVSNNGGLLSHLAIMAREKKIPMVVGFVIANSKIKIGDNVQIDGSIGEIKKFDSA